MKQNEKRENNVMRGSLCVRKALPHDLPLMAVMVQQIEGMRDIITEKHVWHLKPCSFGCRRFWRQRQRLRRRRRQRQ